MLTDISSSLQTGWSLGLWVLERATHIWWGHLGSQDTGVGAEEPSPPLQILSVLHKHLFFCPTVSPTSYLVSCLLAEICKHIVCLGLACLLSLCLLVYPAAAPGCLVMFLCINLGVGAAGKCDSHRQRGRLGWGVSCSVTPWPWPMPPFPPSFWIPCFILNGSTLGDGFWQGLRHLGITRS